MIDASHFVAVSFLLFVALVVYKKFFGAVEKINQGIVSIVDELENAEKTRQESEQRLQESMQRLKDIEPEILKIKEGAAKTIETITNNKMHDIALMQNSIEEKHANFIAMLERTYLQKFQGRFVDLIIEAVKEQISKQTTVTVESHLVSSLYLLDAISHPNQN